MTDSCAPSAPLFPLDYYYQELPSAPPMESEPLTEKEAEDLLTGPEGSTTSQAASVWWQSQSSAPSSTDLAGSDSDPTSWKSIIKVLTSSVKASATHVQAFTVETLALGWMPLMKSHEQEADRIMGKTVTDRSFVSFLLLHARWADASYHALSNPASLSVALGIQLPDVIYICQGQGTGSTTSLPSSTAPHLPAYFVAVAHDARTIRLVVRGTSALKDLVTDLCGHTVPFLEGHAHYGMMRAAQALVTNEIDRLSQVLKTYPGYSLQLVGHSLGGGVAALAACMLHRVPELQAKLGGVQVTAVTFATPPVVTLDVAQSCATFITTVVNENDMVARTSVATIAELTTHMEAAKASFMQNSEVVAMLQSTGAAANAKGLATAAFKYYAMRRPAAAVAGYLAKGPAMRGIVGMGLQLAGTALVSALTESPAQAAASTPNATGSGSRATSTTTATGSPQPSPATVENLRAAAASAQASLGSAWSALSLRVKANAATLQQEAKAAGVAVDGKTSFTGVVAQARAAGAASISATTITQSSPAGPLSQDASTTSIVSVTSAAPAASTTAVSTTTTTTTTSSWFSAANVQSMRLLGGALLNKVDEAVAARSAASANTTTATSVRSAASGSSSGVLSVGDGAAAGSKDQDMEAAGVDTSISAAEDQRLHRLFCPGKLYHLQKQGVPPNVRGSLIEGDGRQEVAFQRLLLKRTMLWDHFLAQYLASLRRVEAQLT